MGMFSEIDASGNCRDYEDILLKAINDGNPVIVKFAKEVIYPKYKWELGEAWKKENENIKEYFNKK